MPTYYIKPVVWNTNGYTQPSGVKFHSGYPKDNGFGHEEWNGHPQSNYTDETGDTWSIFHTQLLGLQPVNELAGNIFIFMIAATNGIQKLVGIAGMASSLVGDEYSTEKELIRKKMGLSYRERREHAWKIQSVKDAFENNKIKFNTQWASDNLGLPTWKCPTEYYIWLESPIQLNPIEISGNNKFIMMFSSYQKINKHQALYILSLVSQHTVRESTDFKKINSLIEACQNDELDIETDINEINNRPDDEISKTERQTLIQARKGQGKFRQDLISRWQGCAVNGSTIHETLRASHIKPWRNSTDKQRLDVENGILLNATLDALFDSGLISFENDGKIIISNSINIEEYIKIGITTNTSLRKAPTTKMQIYLNFHRENIFLI